MEGKGRGREREMDGGEESRGSSHSDGKCTMMHKRKGNKQGAPLQKHKKCFQEAESFLNFQGSMHEAKKKKGEKGLSFVFLQTESQSRCTETHFKRGKK